MHPPESAARPATCHPLTLTRDLRDIPIANRPLGEHQAAAIAAAAPAGVMLHRHPHAWLAAGDLARLDAAGPATLAAADGTPLAWLGEAPDPGSAVVAADSFVIVHPWDLLRANEAAVGAIDRDEIHGVVHRSVVVEGFLHLGAGSRVLPGVFIEGKVVIGAGCKVGPNCYLRGATAIGDRCHIGQAVEIKNSIILAGASVGHLSYLGDSILAEMVNFGAGTIVSNLRHDGANHRSMVGGKLVDTGRRKFGAVVGDRVHTGIHTAIYPGRKLWPATSTRPGEIVRHDLIS